MDWPEDGALDLLRELMVHCLQDKFVISIDYEVGDLAAWDTFSTLHRATPIAAVEPGENARTLWRVSVNGLSPLYSKDETFQS